MQVMKQSNQKVMKWEEKSLLPCPLKVHLKYHILIRILDERNGLKKDKQNTILGGKLYSQVQVYYLFHAVNSFLRMKLKGNCELFGTDDVYIVHYKHFAMYIKKCLQTAYCVLCCDLMNKQIYPFFKVTTIKCFLILNQILNTDLS